MFPATGIQTLEIPHMDGPHQSIPDPGSRILGRWASRAHEHSNPHGCRAGDAWRHPKLQSWQRVTEDSRSMGLGRVYFCHWTSETFRNRNLTGLSEFSGFESTGEWTIAKSTQFYIRICRWCSLEHLFFPSPFLMTILGGHELFFGKHMSDMYVQM